METQTFGVGERREQEATRNQARGGGLKKDNSNSGGSQRIEEKEVDLACAEGGGLHDRRVKPQVQAETNSQPKMQRRKRQKKQQTKNNVVREGGGGTRATAHD